VSLVTSNESTLSDFGWIVWLPVVSHPFQPLNFSRLTINPVAIDYGTRLWISAAFGVVVFAKDKLKISAGCLFCAVGNTIQRDSVRIDAVMFKGLLE
jgi:hypothetical protein